VYLGAPYAFNDISITDIEKENDWEFTKVGFQMIHWNERQF